MTDDKLGGDAGITCALTMIAPLIGLLSPCHFSQSSIHAQIRFFFTLILACAGACCHMDPPGAAASPAPAAEMAASFSLFHREGLIAGKRVAGMPASTHRLENALGCRGLEDECGRSGLRLRQLVSGG